MDGRKKKMPNRISIEHAKNGGFVVNHSFDNMGAAESYQPPETYAFEDHKAMMAHVHKATGAGRREESEPTGQAHPTTRALPPSPTSRM